MKVQAVIALKAAHSLELSLAAAGLARSTFFYHQARLAVPDPQADLKTAIEEVFAAAKGRDGTAAYTSSWSRTGGGLRRRQYSS